MAIKSDNHEMSTSVHFSIKYDGPALVGHQMDVRELAPALIALSELLEQANKAAFPNAAEVRVNIQGNFKGLKKVWEQWIELHSCFGVFADVGKGRKTEV